MTQLYLKFAQQQQADEGFNRGLGLLAASTYPGRNPNLVMNAMTSQTADPGALFGNIMKLQQDQQQKQMLLNYQRSVPDLVKSLNLDPSYIPLFQANPDLAQQMIQGRQPEGAYRNYQAAELDYIKNSGVDMNNPAAVAKARSEFETQHPLDQALTPTGGDPAIATLQADKALWMKNNPGEPVPDRFNSPEANLAYKAKQQALSTAQTSAAGTFPGLNSSLLDMRSKADGILNSPDLETVLQKAPNVLAGARAGGWGTYLAQGFGMTPEQFDLLHKIDDLTSSNTSALKTANPHLMTSITPIESSLGSLSNFNIGPDNYKKALKGLTDSIDTARAQAIGASGMLDVAAGDPNVAGKVDKSYLPGGQNFVGEPRRLTPEEITWAKQKLAAGASKDELIQHFKLFGALPRGEF
jgi:hypothetical protein